MAPFTTEIADAWSAGKGAEWNKFNLAGTCFEEYWAKLPVDAQKDTLRLDGFSFKGRMAAIKYLIYFMDDSSLWERAGSSGFREYHWLWAYAAQMDWQHRSGRFMIGSTKKNKDIISTSSWWGYMNFCFSVCVLVGAQKAGVCTIKLELDEESQRLLEEDEGVKKSVAAWETLFRNGYATYKSQLAESVSDETFMKLRFQFQQEAWKSHTEVIYATVGEDAKNAEKKSPKMAEMLEVLEAYEQNFGLGWCRMVEVLAACCFPTDLVALIQCGAGFLPLELVAEEKINEYRADKLSGVELKRYRAVENTYNLLHAPNMKSMSDFFRRVVRNEPFLSREMPFIINKATHGEMVEKVLTVFKIMSLYWRPRGWVEWSLLFAFVAAVAAYFALRLMK